MYRPPFATPAYAVGLICICVLLGASHPAMSEYPQPGFDKVGADVELLVDVQGEKHTLKASGLVVVRRAAPMPTGITETIPIEIVALNLTGTSPIGGEFLRVGIEPGTTANGLLRQRTPGSEFGVDSFFDITY